MPFRSRVWFAVAVAARRLYDVTHWDALARFVVWTFRRGADAIARH